MEADSHEKWVMRAANCVRGSGSSVHRHVFDRLATLLCLEDIAWVDGQVNELDDGVHGRILVFTRDLLAIVDITGEARPHQHEQVTGRPQGTTLVRVVPRTALIQVSLPGADETDPRRSTPGVWARFAFGGRINQEGWPRFDAPVELTYPGETVAVNGPIGATTREGFDEFMATVMVDLAQ